MWAMVAPIVDPSNHTAQTMHGCTAQVIRGYIGDGSAKPVFEGASPFNVLGTGYQRPFELATLRLRNMVGILPECALPRSAGEGNGSQQSTWCF